MKSLESPLKARKLHFSAKLVILFILLSAIAFTPVQAVTQGTNATPPIPLPSASQSSIVRLNVTDRLFITGQPALLNSLVLAGNTSAIMMSGAQKNLTFPAPNITFVAVEPGSVQLAANFNCTCSYSVYVQLRPLHQPARNVTSYFISSGALLLTLTLTVIIDQTTGANSFGYALPTFEAFSAWATQFGASFPVWVKYVYLLFALGFSFVGYTWIKRETEKRKSTSQQLDWGNQVFLAVDVISKYFTATFATIMVLMILAWAIPWVISFMFLIPLNFVSLWDVFALIFTLGMTAIAYIVRFSLIRLEFKPTLDE